MGGTPQQRPYVNGSPVLSGNRSTADQLAEWFDTSMFSAPAAGTYGGLGRNALIGSAMNSTNAGMMKNFSFSHREGGYAEFRFEVFSLFNTPIFKNPGNTMGSSFGKITSTSGGNRQLQLALKIVF